MYQHITSSCSLTGSHPQGGGLIKNVGTLWCKAKLRLIKQDEIVWWDWIKLWHQNVSLTANSITSQQLVHLFISTLYMCLEQWICQITHFPRYHYFFLSPSQQSWGMGYLNYSAFSPLQGRGCKVRCGYKILIYRHEVLTLFHMIGVFKGQVASFQGRLFYCTGGMLGVSYSSPTRWLFRKSRLFPFCEYVEENTLGSLKTPVCVSASNLFMWNKVKSKFFNFLSHRLTHFPYLWDCDTCKSWQTIESSQPLGGPEGLSW